MKNNDKTQEPRHREIPGVPELRSSWSCHFPGLTNSQSQRTMAQAIAPIPNKDSPKIWGDALKLKRREDAIIREEIIMATEFL